jgi:hypothetical protein
MDQIWTFNLSYIYADWSFCYTHLTYNVFSFSGIWHMLYLISCIYDILTYTYMTYTSLSHRRALLEWGRKSLDRNKENGGLEWMEIWGLDDVLVLFGFPDDNEKPIKTTYLRGVLQDDAHTI